MQSNKKARRFVFVLVVVLVLTNVCVYALMAALNSPVFIMTVLS